MLYMRTLEHRGQKIICQYIDDNFGRILAKKNIKYSILPVFSDNYIVYKCIVDGVVYNYPIVRNSIWADSKTLPDPEFQNQIKDITQKWLNEA